MCVIKKKKNWGSCKRSPFCTPLSLSLHFSSASSLVLPLVVISVGRKLGNGVRLGRAVGLRVGRILFIMFSYLCCLCCCCQLPPPAKRLRFLLLTIKWEQTTAKERDKGERASLLSAAWCCECAGRASERPFCETKWQMKQTKHRHRGCRKTMHIVCH